MTLNQSSVIQGRFFNNQPRLSVGRPVVQVHSAADSLPLNIVQQHQQTIAAHEAALLSRPSRNLPVANTLQQQPARTSLAAPLPNIPGRTVVQPRSATQPAQQETIQRTANGQAFQLPSNLSNFAGSVGQPLPEPVRQKMESFFNASFGDVRVHVGAQASSIGALAFTHGSNLYFAPGQYNPHTVQGQQLLGHELTHVLQQRAGLVKNPFGSGVAVVQDRGMEAEADRNGMRAAAHRVLVQAKRSASGVLSKIVHADGVDEVSSSRQDVPPGVKRFGKLGSNGASDSVVQRMESTTSAFVGGGLLIFERNSGSEKIRIVHDTSEDKLRGTYWSSDTGTIDAGYLSYTHVAKNEVLPDEVTKFSVPFCHQNYIHVETEVRQKGISYLFAYAGVLQAIGQGYEFVGTNMPNQNSAKLAMAIGFNKNPKPQIKKASVVAQKALEGLTRNNWRVTGGSLSAASGSSSSSGNSVPISTDTTPLIASSNEGTCCCFITSACCQSRGLPDDCRELTTLRSFRDNYLLQVLQEGPTLVEQYYRIAPAITRQIEQQQFASEIYAGIFTTIQECVRSIDRQDYDFALEAYREMVLDLSKEFLPNAVYD